MYKMSNLRFIELSSTNRNRVLYPNPAQFDVSFSSPPSNYQFERINFAYLNNEKLSTILTKNSNIIDTVTTGIIYFLWQYFNDNGILYTGSSGLNIQAIINSTIYTNNVNSYIGKYILILDQNSNFVGLQIIQNATYTIGDPLNVFTITFTNSINFPFYPYDYNYSIPVDGGQIQTGSTSNLIIVNGLTSVYTKQFNLYVGYQINIYSTTASPSLIGSSIILSYNPNKSRFGLSSPINTILTNSMYFTITDPSTTSSIVLPLFDSCGKQINDYEQFYNNYYIIDETLSTNSIVSSKISNYNFLTRTVTLSTPFPNTWNLSNQYSIRQTIPEEKMITTSLPSMTGNVISQTNSTTINISGLSTTFNYSNFQINITGYPLNTIASFNTQLILKNQVTILSFPVSFTITPLFPSVSSYSQLLLTNQYVYLPSTANSNDNYYTGKYIYIYPNQVSNNETTSLVNIQGSCFYINSYIGNGYNVCFLNNIPNTEFTALTKFYPSYTNQIPNSIQSGTTINIVSLVKDNFTPLIYNGSRVSQNELVAYEISLLNLTLPNQTLITGSNTAYYPYVYVEFSVENNLSKNVIYSNNPDSDKALFLVPITDIKNLNTATFIKLYGGSMTQTVKFRPNDTLKFSVYLPNGKLFQTVITDYYAPSLPNSFVQIDALFGIVRLSGL
jgi:hypothetical protein